MIDPIVSAAILLPSFQICAATSAAGQFRGVVVMRDLVMAAALGAVLAGAAVSPAAAEDDVKGKWFNTFEVNGLPQPVWISIAHLDHGKDQAARLQYSKPRDCYVSFEYGGEAAGFHVFYMSGYGGDVCYANFVSNRKQTVLRVRLSPDANLIYDVMVDGKTAEKGLLKRT